MRRMGRPRAAKVELSLGIVLALCCGVLAWRGLGNEGFRFIWAGDEGEFTVFVIVLGLIAVILLATAGVALGAGRWLVRGAIYLCGTCALMLVALGAGTSYYDATDCPSGDSDCLSLLGGMVWALIAVPVSIVVIVVIELMLWRKRKVDRISAQSGG